MFSGPFIPLSSPLVSAAWLAQHIHNSDVRVLDVRWYLAGKRGADEYAAGHIPGAVFVDLDAQLSAPKGSGPGRHPLPSAPAFVNVVSQLGITATTHVIAYDDAGGAIAARFYWMLRHFGLTSAAILNGGIQAWTAQGGALSTNAPCVMPAPKLALAPRVHQVIDKQRVNALRSTAGVVILDARATERFEGKSEPIDARPGHIPGARSMPFANNLVAPGGEFQSRDALAEKYAALGVMSAETVVCYCGSGVTACHNLVALSLIGRTDALLYEGSWSDWAADPELPSELGSAQT
ncbi:MAG: sulfurtransferase [Polyangiaceae bacterium]|nr:sulfurtransferase [Polyangiaceae bacterium]